MAAPGTHALACFRQPNGSGARQRFCLPCFPIILPSIVLPPSRQGAPHAPLWCIFVLASVRQRCRDYLEPRKPRVQHPGAICHVMSRGDRREDIFLAVVDCHDPNQRRRSSRSPNGSIWEPPGVPTRGCMLRCSRRRVWHREKLKREQEMNEDLSGNAQSNG